MDLLILSLVYHCIMNILEFLSSCFCLNSLLFNRLNNAFTNKDKE